MGNTLRLDTFGFSRMIEKLDSLGGDVESAVSDALQTAAAKIADDTEKALADQYLPAQGKYSNGDTEKSIIRNPSVEWDGSIAWVPVGFDFSKPGAGGYLITGTPKMPPDRELNKIYKQKRYMTQLQKIVGDKIADYVIEKMKEG